MAAVLDRIEEVLASGAPSVEAVHALATELKALALTDLQRAIELADRLDEFRCDDGAVAVELLSARAHVLCYATRFDDATALLARAASIAERASHTAALAQVRLTSVQPLARAGRLGDAQSAAQDARDAFARCKDMLGQAKSMLNLGIVQRMRGDPQAALTTFDDALPLLHDQPMLKGALASNRAEALLDLDRFAEAESAFAAARDAFTLAGNDHAAAIVEGNLADLYAREGRLDVALERFELARRHYEASGASGDVARLDAESAEAMAALGAHDAAVLALGQSLPELERAGLLREWQRGQFVLATCLLAGGHDGAARGVLQALLGQLADDEPVLRGRCLIARAVLDIAARDPSAGDTADAGLALLEGRPARLAQAHAWLADALLRAGELDRAIAHIDALEASDVAPSLAPVRAQLAHLRGRVLRERGQAEAAAVKLREAMLAAEGLRGAQRADRWRIACGQHWRDAYVDAMSAALDLGDTDGAMEALERIRGRSLLERAGSSAARPPDAPLRERLDALNVYYARLDAGQETPELLTKIRQAEDEAERLRTRDDALAGDARVASEPAPLEGICAALPASTAIVQYFIEAAGIGAFVVRPEGATVVRSMASEAELSAAMARLRFAIDEDDSANAGLWDAGVRAIARSLLAPIAELLGGVEHLALSLPAALEGVPWPALPWGGGFTVDRFVLHIVPSATFAVLEPGATGHDRVVAIGVADELAPSMQDEARAVAAAAGGVAFTGADATADRVLGALGEADVVHLATHCAFSPRHPMASRLKMADRWLSAHELVRAVRPGSRVVLAGCETGRAGGVNVEDRTGLVSAMLARGAVEVVSARWPLHDATAMRIFGAMYELLASNRTMSLANALRHAQRQAVREGTPPWRYAALQATGGIK